MYILLTRSICYGEHVGHDKTKLIVLVEEWYDEETQEYHYSDVRQPRARIKPDFEMDLIMEYCKDGREDYCVVHCKDKKRKRVA